MVLLPHPKLIAIGAMAENRVIGVDGRMPWHIPDEFRWFREATLGHAVLMGRRTFESIGRPLPGRRNLVATRRLLPFSTPQDVELIPDLDAFDPDTVPSARIFVAGGAEVYRQLLPRCSELWLTEVHRRVDGDAVFPEFEPWFCETECLREHPEFRVGRWIRSSCNAQGQGS